MNLFAYGTLMDPAVWARVARDPSRGVPARLPGYRACCLRDCDFPGLIEAAETVTPGLLYCGVSPPAMARLDAYEDDFYRRVPVMVTLAAGGQIEAQVYLMDPGHRDLVLPVTWVPPFDAGSRRA